jgi:hypothetical protein
LPADLRERFAIVETQPDRDAIALGQLVHDFIEHRPEIDRRCRGRRG